MKSYTNISEYNEMLYDSGPVSINEYISEKYNIVHNKLYNDALEKYLKSLIIKYVNNDFIIEWNNIQINSENEYEIIEDISNRKNYIISNVLTSLELSSKILFKIYPIIKNFLDNINSIDLEIINNFDLLYNDILPIFIKEYKRSHNIIEIKDTEYWMPSKIIIVSNKPPYFKKSIDLKPYWNKYQTTQEYDISDLKITKENVLDSEVCELDYIKGMALMESKSNDIQYKIPFKYLDENTKVSPKLKLDNTFIEKM